VKTVLHELVTVKY